MCRFTRGSLFFSLRLNNWGCFVHLTEWRAKEKNRFAIILEGEESFGWMLLFFMFFFIIFLLLEIGDIGVILTIVFGFLLRSICIL